MRQWPSLLNWLSMLILCACTVGASLIYYHTSDPIPELPTLQNHRLSKDSKPIETASTGPAVDFSFEIWGTVVACLGALSYLTLPIYPGKPSGSGLIPTGGKGDAAAGEYLTMESGQFTATQYVGFAFGIEVVALAYFGYLGLQAVMDKTSNPNLIVGGAAAIATAVTLLIYWDRWRAFPFLAAGTVQDA